MKRRGLSGKSGKGIISAALMAGSLLLAGMPVPVETLAEETAEEFTEAESEASGIWDFPEEMAFPEPEKLEGEKVGISSGTLETFRKTVIKDNEEIGEVSFTVYTVNDIRPVGTDTPVIFVYDEQAVSTERAEEILTVSGLDEIAKEENCLVCFVNPMGENWGEEDAAAYLYTLSDIWSEDTGSETGKTQAEDKLIGTSQRFYIIANGAGADFAAQFLAKETMKRFFIFTDFYYEPAAVMLFNTSEKISCANGMPAVVVNATDEQVEALKSVNQTDEVTEEEGFAIYTNSGSPVRKFMTAEAAEAFDAAVVRSGWDNVISTVRRQLSGVTEEAYELLPVYDYASMGLNVSIKTTQIGEKTIEWYEYIPEDLDMSVEDSVPLVLAFHGGGNHAQYLMNASEWPLAAKENGFMVAAVNQHVEISADDIIKFLDYLEETCPAIDESKVYSTGFSMGSVKSLELGMQYPERFAGIAPMDAVIEPMCELKDMIIPTFYLAGEDDGLLVFPHQVAFGGEGGEGNGDYTIQRIFAMNHVEYTGYDETLDPVWGMEFDGTEQISTANGLHVVTENFKKSEDGNIYTALCTMSNQAHATLAGSTYAAWDFLKQFSRNEDGTISIDQ